MTIKLRSIRLKNWKCYQDQKIKFNLNTDNRIWIVFGQNGFGKTSILEAIQWCLYGSDVIANTELLECFNRIAIKKNSEIELAVQLSFEADGDNYNISRTAKRIIRGTTPSAQPSEPTVQKNGVNQPDVREHIEEILPKSCKGFFFFDGVQIKSYAQKMHNDATRAAIERILGIPELCNLRSDAESAMLTIERKLKDAGLANKLLQEQTDKSTDIQENLKTREAQCQEAQDDYEAALKILQDAKERASQIEALRGKLDDLSRLERDQARLQENLNAAENDLEEALRKASIPLMIEFVREVKDDMQSITMTTARRSGSVEQLRELLKVDTCVCGRCMDESSRQYIHKELERLESSNNLTRDALRQDNLRKQLEVLSEFQIPNFNELLLSRHRLEDELEEVKQTIYRLKQETQGVDTEEAIDIWKKVSEAERLAGEKKEKIERLQREIEDLRQQEDQLRREIEKIASQDSETKTLGQQLNIANGLHQAVKELIEWRIVERKGTIEAYTSEIHHHVTNKPEEYTGVEIREDYALRVKNAAGEILNPETLSAGEKEVLAFAFIAGLNLASGKAAPLIMDTPFGHLDIDHQKNLVNALPNLPSQVILLATDRDLPDHLLQSIQPDVAEIHRIRRLGATEDASIVEVEA